MLYLRREVIHDRGQKMAECIFPFCAVRVDPVAIVKVDAKVRHFMNISKKEKVWVKIPVNSNAMPVAVAASGKVADLAGSTARRLEDKWRLTPKFKHVIQCCNGNMLAEQGVYFSFFHIKKGPVSPFCFWNLDRNYSAAVVSASIAVVSASGASSSIGVTVSSVAGSCVVSASFLVPPPHAIKAEANPTTISNANSFFIVDRF